METAQQIKLLRISSLLQYNSNRNITQTIASLVLTITDVFWKNTQPRSETV